MKSLKGIFIVLIAIVATIIVGCDNMSNPVSPSPATPTTMGELKQAATTRAGGISAEGVEVVSGGSAAAPSIVKQIDAEGTLTVSLSHIETEEDGDEIIAITAKSGQFVGNDKFRFYAGGRYLGRVTLPEDAVLIELHIRMDDADLGTGESNIEVEVSRNGRIIADAELALDRAIPGPRLEEARIGEFADEVVLVFSEDVDAFHAIKDNLRVVNGSGEVLQIRSFGENADEITLIMRKDLSVGEYTITYSGEGGLESLSGEPLRQFSTTLVVGDGDAADEEPTEDTAVWKTIPHGLYSSGDQFLVALDAFGYLPSNWTREILGTIMFQVQSEVGTTDLYRVTAADLGLNAPYSAKDIILAVAGAGYQLVPSETAAQLRLLMPEQPVGETLLVVSGPLNRPGQTSKYMLALGGGNAEHPGKHLFAVGVEETLNSGEYPEFIVTKQ